MSDTSQHKPPGMLGSQVETDVVMMICTAGHVDHGKTRLVKLLTGCETDRLKTERERGLTIELGFAPCMIGGASCVGIVDVPGHEKFIRNMVAGVSGIGLAVLVVAADDGVMPQTVEHVRIMELLGVARGVVALTKIDLVDDDRRKEVEHEVSEFLRGTFLEGAPVCPVSSETFEGIPEFYGILADAIASVTKQRRHGVFRMPVAQVFNRPGFGLVIMGIPVDGSVSTGDRVVCVPGGKTGKVRAIQQFMRETGDGDYGQCLALNVPELNRNPPNRGDVITLPGYLIPVRTLHARITTVSGLNIPLRNAEAVKLHTGTAEENGKLYLLEAATLDGGVTGFASVVLSNPVVAAPHDRFIIRRPSPAATVAGGEILAVDNSDRKPRKRIVADMLRGYMDFLGDADPSDGRGNERRIEYHLRLRDIAETLPGDIAKSTLLFPDTVSETLERLTEKGNAVPTGSGGFIHAEPYRRLLKELEMRLRTASDSGEISMTPGDLQRGLKCPPQVWKTAIAELERRGILARRADRIILAEAMNSLGDEDRDTAERIVELFERSEFRSPRPDELPDIVGFPVERVERLLDYLYERGDLVRLSKNVVLSRTYFRKAQDLVVSIIERDGVLDSSDFKHHLGSTRKYALAVLDRLDAMRITIRSGNERVLVNDYERNLIE